MASHQFSLGSRGRLHPHIVNATAGLYRILSEDHSIQSAVKIPFVQAVGPDSIPFSRESYQELVKERLIDRICTPESAAYFFDQPELIDGFRALDMQKLKRYFRSKDLERTRAYMRGLPNDEMRNVISVLFTQVHQILPLTLDKTYLVHYGLCPADQEIQSGACHPFIGIPYHSGSPVVTSRFGTDLESLNYMIQSHLQRGNVLEMFKLEVERLKGLFRRNRSPEVRAAFASYFGAQLSDGQILNLSDAEVVARSGIVSLNPILVLDLVKRYAAPKIEVFPNQLFTNAHIYPVLFKKIHGMTGTLWNSESFPEFYVNPPIGSDALARTLTALWKVPASRQVQIIDTPVPGQSVGEILDLILGESGARSIIDQGAFLRGKDNQEVASALLGRNQARAGTSQYILYDSDHHIKIMRSVGGVQSIHPYAAQDNDRTVTAAFWDMQHTTGSDLKVNSQASAVLTLSKYSIMRDLLQAAWRLRDLEQSQTVTLVVTRDDLRIMSKLLMDVFGHSQRIAEDSATVPLEKILLYLATNEAIKVGEVNFRSVKASQKAKIIDSIFDTLVDHAAFGDSVIVAFNLVKPFFSNPTDQSPYERYGAPIVSTGTADFLRREIQWVLAPVRQVFASLVELEEQFETILRNKVEVLRTKTLAALRPGVDSDDEIEVENDNEIEEEEEQEEEKEVERHEIESQYRKPLVNWVRDRFFDGSLIEHPIRANELPTDRIAAAQIATLAPLMSIQDIFQRGDLGNYADLFDEDLFGSLNLFPLFQSTDLVHDREFKPFGKYQGQMDYVWVPLRKNGTNLYEVRAMVLITRDEALEKLGKWLVVDTRDARGQSANDEHSNLIYQFGNGFIRSNGAFMRSVGGEDRLIEAYRVIEEDRRFKELLM